MVRTTYAGVPGILLLAVLLLSSTAAVPSRSVGPGDDLSGTSTVTAHAAAPARIVQLAPGFVATAGTSDLGPLDPNTPLEVVVGLAPRDPAGLLARADLVSAPGSPQYRSFLSAPSAEARYGASATAIAEAKGYFDAFGLSTSANPDGLLVSVSGPAGSLGRAFNTSFERFRGPNGSTFFDHVTPARLPAVAPWTGAYGLGDSRPFTPGVRGTNAAANPLAACAASGGVLTPCEIQQAYDFGPELGAGVNGTGVRVGVVDPYAGEEPQNALSSDLATFASANALPVGNVAYLYPVPTTAILNSTGTNPGWGLEEAVDLEWARAAAPGASLVMTFSPNAGSGLYFAIDALVASFRVDVLSLSWGEPDVGSFNPISSPCSSACNASSDGSYAVLGPILELATVEGISTYVASGDCGAADGTAGVSTNFPASEPWVTGVGGTNLTVGAGGGYVSESGWSGNGSGGTGAGCQNQGGSGGGFAPFPRPWWQQGPGTRGTHRGVPDVAINAQHAVQLVEQGTFSAAFGTSVGAPVWAGIGALADQAAGHDLGLLDPSIYALLNSTNYSNTFHDLRTGNNGYATGTGWDPVTGVGSPVVGALVPRLAANLPTPSTVRPLLYASPRFGPAPLTTEFVLTAQGGSGSYPLRGVAFGDGNATLAPNGTATHTYANAGVYSATAFVVDSNGSTSTSPPVLVVVGGGDPISVTLTASTATPAVGAAVTFNVTVSGGVAPYLLNLSFGDALLAVNLSTLTATHAYLAAGAYCAEAVVRDAAHPPDGGASARVALGVGGAALPSCGNPSSPLLVTPIASPGVRDAPADYPTLFTESGGVVGTGLSLNVSTVSNDPYTVACGCSIFRSAGNYSVTRWANDSVNGQANGSVNVTVAPPLNVSFLASTLSGPVPLVVNFAAIAHGGYRTNVSTTRWTFGDGTGATGASAQVTYTSSGEYVATALLSDRGHGNASEAFLIDVEPAGPPGVGIVGTIVPAFEVRSGTNVTLSASLVGPASALAGLLVEWNLGNGQSAFGLRVTETYLTGPDVLANNTLAAGVSVLGVHLRPLFRFPITLRPFFATEAGGFVPAVSALSADADIRPVFGVVPLTVQGNATASGPGGVNVGWTFGDLVGSASGTNVSYTYFASGAYTVNATAYDGFHDQVVRLNEVVVNQALGVSGGPDRLTGRAPLTVTFAVSAFGGAGGPYAYRWTSALGSEANVTNLTLSFSSAGRYVVSLEVTDSANASVMLSWTVVVEPAPPIAAWEVVLAGGAVGAAVAIVAWLRRPRGPDRLIL